MLEGINIISTEVIKYVTIPIFIISCAIACVFMFFVNPNFKNWF